MCTYFSLVKLVPKCPEPQTWRSNKQNEGCSVLLSYFQDLKNGTNKLRIQIKYMQVKFLQSSIPDIMGWNPFWNSIPTSMLLHFHKIFVQFSGWCNLNESWLSREMHVNENINAPSEWISPCNQLRRGSNRWSGIGFQTVL